MIPLPAVASTSTIFPFSKRSSRPSTRVPAAISGAVERTVPSVRRQSGLVNTSSVGRFGRCSTPSAVWFVAHFQSAARDEADREIGTGAAEAERVERALVHLHRARLELRRVLAPRGDEVRLVEPGTGRDGVPQPVHVGLAEHLRRPALVRRGDDGPVHRSGRSRA